MGRRAALLAKGLLALFVSVAALWWAFHDVDLGGVLEKLKSSSVPVVITFVVAQLIVHLVRVVRWGLLVRPLGEANGRAIFAAASVGLPAAFFLPLRIGELVRPAMLARSGVPFVAAMTSVVVERTADGVANLGIFFTLLSVLPKSSPLPDQLRDLSALALAGFGGVLIVLTLTAVTGERAVLLLDRLLSRAPERVRSRITGLARSFVLGVAPLRSPWRLGSFVLLTIVYWGINGAATWLVAESYVEGGLPFLAGPFALSVVVFAVMLPSGPAFAGTLEAGFRFGMAPFGVSSQGSAVVAVAIHALQILILAALAGIGLLAAEPRQRGRVTS